jgi:hypothetical protein
MAWGRTGACVPRQKVDKISLFSLSTCGSTRKFTRHPVTAQRVGLPWRRIQHVLFRALQTRGLGNSIVLTTRRLSKATRTSATRHVDVVNKYQGKENSFTYSRKLFLHCLFTTNTCKIPLRTHASCFSIVYLPQIHGKIENSHVDGHPIH